MQIRNMASKESKSSFKNSENRRDLTRGKTDSGPPRQGVRNLCSLFPRIYNQWGVCISFCTAGGQQRVDVAF